ncbi:aquaporin-like protein [Meira miltonrushii]|uniref:Aquaporin-like protein n=1 Tax=Meira miltonrushii TaxID=1280837 RepID=A0A316V1I5_9BASI|nr:aquaporin-like protein [Meira miltonrushii]PWN31406.1 aquaporin-like protein [Meira miltonrushii]
MMWKWHRQDDLHRTLDGTTVLVIATSFGLSLTVTAWAFFRITGGLFNPAITLALWLVGVLTSIRAVVLAIVQILGGTIAAALVLALTPGNHGVDTVNNSLTDVSIAQGFFLEMLGTAILVFVVLLLAVEKHRATFIAPVGIGLALFAIHLFLLPWTGCAVNPSRAFGPAVISGHFPGIHWIYWIAPLSGSISAVIYFEILKAFEYNHAVMAIDSEKEMSKISPIYVRIRNRIRSML